MKNTLLFGNGLNRMTEGLISWEDLLDSIKNEPKVKNIDLPNTMIYEQALLEKKKSENGIFSVEKKIKEEIASKMKNIPTNIQYQQAFELGFDNYLTTNYDYAFRDKIIEIADLKHKNNSSEDIYRIRRYTALLDKNANEICRIWNIHGEIDKPASIMLGLDHYCGSIGKIDSYIKGFYSYKDLIKSIEPIGVKIEQENYDNISWVELFYRSNIHILGLSLDYSETDLWWVLNKRARTIKDVKHFEKIKNKIYYYIEKEDVEKEKLLKSFDVHVVNLAQDNTKIDYGRFYNEAFEIINKQINKQVRGSL